MGQVQALSASVSPLGTCTYFYLGLPTLQSPETLPLVGPGRPIQCVTQCSLKVGEGQKSDRIS